MEVLQGLLDVDVTMEAWTGQDRYGKGTFGSVVTIKARVEDSVEEVPGPLGQALVSRYKVILGKALQVDARDRLTLPKEFGTRDESGQFQTVQPPILRVRPVYFRGVHDHTIIWCG